MIYQLNENKLRKVINSSIKQVLNESINPDLLKSIENIMICSQDAYKLAQKDNIDVWKGQIARLLKDIRFYLDKIDSKFSGISQSIESEY